MQRMSSTFKTKNEHLIQILNYMLLHKQNCITVCLPFQHCQETLATVDLQATDPYLICLYTHSDFLNSDKFEIPHLYEIGGNNA